MPEAFQFDCWLNVNPPSLITARLPRIVFVSLLPFWNVHVALIWTTMFVSPLVAHVPLPVLWM